MAPFLLLLSWLLFCCYYHRGSFFVIIIVAPFAYIKQQAKSRMICWTGLGAWSQRSKCVRSARFNITKVAHLLLLLTPPKDRYQNLPFYRQPHHAEVRAVTERSGRGEQRRTCAWRGPQPSMGPRESQRGLPWQPRSQKAFEDLSAIWVEISDSGSRGITRMRLGRCHTLSRTIHHFGPESARALALSYCGGHWADHSPTQCLVSWRGSS